MPSPINNTHWADAAARLQREGRHYVLITLLGVRGSTPRDNGTKMVVCDGENFGTIGGGHLEYKAIEKAVEIISAGEACQSLENVPLGAKLGQCCGGSVSVLFECFVPQLVNIALYGAGHVGRALISILKDLPVNVFWVDSREAFLDVELPDNVEAVVDDEPVDAVRDMPADTYYLVMTHNHGLDFDLCRAIIERADAAYIGLIGSDTKWQRFRLRFEHRGFSPERVKAIHCPVGLSAVPGKLPMEVAVSIAGELIGLYQQRKPTRKTQRGIDWKTLQPALNFAPKAPQPETVKSEL